MIPNIKKYLDDKVTLHLPKDKYVSCSLDLINFESLKIRQASLPSWERLFADLEDVFKIAPFILLDQSRNSSSSWDLVLSNPEKKISYSCSISLAIPFFIDFYTHYEKRGDHIDCAPFKKEQAYIHSRIISFFPDHQALPKSLYQVTLPGIKISQRKANQGRYIDLFFMTDIITDEGSY